MKMKIHPSTRNSHQIPMHNSLLTSLSLRTTNNILVPAQKMTRTKNVLHVAVLTVLTTCSESRSNDV